MHVRRLYIYDYLEVPYNIFIDYVYSLLYSERTPDFQ